MELELQILLIKQTIEIELVGPNFTILGLVPGHPSGLKHNFQSKDNNNQYSKLYYTPV